jgi:putative restriction endonuclease
MSSIKINGVQYTILDTIEKMTVADSFVLRSNKIGSGNGEAKFYIANESATIRTFFGNKGFNVKCILAKKDLLQYLKDSESEYKNPEQDYKNKSTMPSLWEDRLEKVKNLKNFLTFELKEQTQIAGPRIYVKSNSEAYSLIRELSLPNITYLSVIKLESNSNKILYYIRLFIDYFGESVHPYAIEQEVDKITEDIGIAQEEKKNLIKARVGQGKYRKALLEECPFCPITLISDDRLLIASHIKPWVDSDDKEKIDPKNGFMFTPTFDLLFDRGFITFTDDKKIIISPWLSKMTLSRLNIAPEKKYPMLPTEGREHYLEYHRNAIYKG